MEETVQAIAEKRRLKNLKDLRSFMRAINQVNKFLPNLAILCAPLRPLLKIYQEWNWKDEHEIAFNNIKETIKKMTELKQFRRNLELQINCDASNKELASVFHQKLEEKGIMEQLVHSKQKTSK